MKDYEVAKDETGRNKEIDMTLMHGKCVVREPSPDDDIDDEESRENQKVYICRYKLIKHTSYKLVPIGYKPENLDQFLQESHKGKKNRTRHADVVPDDRHDEAADAITEDLSKVKMTVTPVKIVKGKVQKVPRTAANNGDKDDDGDDCGGSPPKRAKKVAERSGRKSRAHSPMVVSETPTQRANGGDDSDDSKESPSKRAKNNVNDDMAQGASTTRSSMRRRASIRKNLNDSFMAKDDDAAVADDDMANYEVTSNEHDGLKLKIKK